MYLLIKYNEKREKEILESLVMLNEVFIDTTKAFTNFNKSNSSPINQFVSWAMDRIFKFQLIINNQLEPFPYESKIIIRSMLEHLINVSYVFKENNVVKTEALIQRLWDYNQDVAPYKECYDALYNPEYGYYSIPDSSLDEYQIKMKAKFIATENKTGFKNKIEKFKNKYEHKNLSYWSDYSVKKLFEKVFYTTQHKRTLFRLFYIYYGRYSTYTHSIMPYAVLSENPFPLIICEDKTRIEILFLSNLFSTLLIESISNFFNIQNCEIENYINKFKSIKDNYEIEY